MVDAQQVTPELREALLVFERLSRDAVQLGARPQIRREDILELQHLRDQQLRLVKYLAEAGGFPSEEHLTALKTAAGVQETNLDTVVLYERTPSGDVRGYFRDDPSFGKLYERLTTPSSLSRSRGLPNRPRGTILSLIALAVAVSTGTLHVRDRTTITELQVRLARSLGEERETLLEQLRSDSARESIPLHRLPRSLVVDENYFADKRAMTARLLPERVDPRHVVIDAQYDERWTRVPRDLTTILEIEHPSFRDRLGRLEGLACIDSQGNPQPGYIDPGVRDLPGFEPAPVTPTLLPGSPPTSVPPVTPEPAPLPIPARRELAPLVLVDVPVIPPAVPEPNDDYRLRRTQLLRQYAREPLRLQKETDALNRQYNRNADGSPRR